MTTTRTSKTATPAIPTTMKAAAIDKFGPPDNLKLHTLPVPKPKPGEVLIALHAAGVGVWDASVRDGSWRPGGRPKFPLVPGTDGAGVVVAKGTRVRRFNLGDRVYASGSGFYAEYVAVDAEDVAKVPKPLDLLQAGAAVVTGLTALEGIDDALRLRRRQTILIYGASGAVGTLAVQFARRRGARVLATASGKDATTLVRRLGADAVIDARGDDAAGQLRSLAPDGIDAILALAGGKELERCLDFVRADGRVAYPNGIEPEPKRRRKIRFIAYDGEPGHAHFAHLNRATTQARLRVPIAASYPLAQAAQAHKRLEQGHVLGRIELKIRAA
ncbi:MAG TPA: NADP-dependent oxidoreductase [Candidatus Solibacter sp.]|nr:NADP-dependent oxidoreductase [Candidatus Solibacter sp.]